MSGEISHYNQVTQVNDVTDVVVTDIVSDGDGGWIRAIRIAVDPNASAPAFELKIQSSAKANLELTTPHVNY